MLDEIERDVLRAVVARLITEREAVGIVEKATKDGIAHKGVKLSEKEVMTGIMWREHLTTQIGMLTKAINS